MEREEIAPGVDRAIDEMECGRREMNGRSDELGDRTDAAATNGTRQADSQVPGAAAPGEEPSDDAEEESE